MFTPSRKRPAIQARRSIAPSRSTPLKDGSRTSLLRRSIAPRSPALSTSAIFASPTVSASLGTNFHNIQSYDSSLPVLVTEAISMSDDFSSISVKIGGDGCACMVFKQRLFVWPHKKGATFRTSVCKELVLPSHLSGLFSSELTHMWMPESSSKSISVIAVSSNGHIFYWPNVMLSGSVTSEAHIDFMSSNEECFNIIPCKPFGHLITSTMGTLYFVEVTSQGELRCQHLSSPSGVLGGIGRRVSSFFFTPRSENINIIQAIARQRTGKKEYQLYLLTSSCLQLWAIEFGQNVTAQLAMETNVYEVMTKLISQAIWKAQKPNVEVWSLDLKLVTSQGHLAVLWAALDPADANKTLFYGLCEIEDMVKCSDAKIIVFKHSQVYEQSIEEGLLDYNLLVEDPFAPSLNHVSMWSCDRLILKNLICDDAENAEDEIEFNISGDRLLGCGNSDGKYVLLSVANGLLTCSSKVQSRLPPSIEESIFNSSTAEANQTMDSSTAVIPNLPGTPVMTQARMNQMEASDNCVQRLQAAFIHYCRHNLQQAQSLVSEAFPSDRENITLDCSVAQVSLELLDDFPASDPRWAESVPHGGSSSFGGSGGSLILQHQLEDKQQAHNMFLKFLSEVGIWNCLGQFSNGKESLVTRRILSEHAEKLCAAISLIKKHATHQGVIDGAIRRTLRARGNASLKGGLTHKDVFYREVSKIDDVLECLVEEEEKCVANSNLSSRDRLAVVSGVNAVFEAMLSSASNFRRSKTIVFQQTELQIEFIPWTIGLGRNSVRSLITQQHKLTVEKGLPEAEDSQQRFALYQSLVTLTDLVLDGFREQLGSLVNNNDRKVEVDAAFQRHKKLLIEPLLNLGQREKATSLAEKYHDFQTLVRVCDESGDQEKMQHYMKHFSSQGFAQFLFKWYLDRKEYRKLLSSCGDSNRHQNELSSYLEAHPKLAWMHQIRTDNYSDAHETLRNLAAAESASLPTKKYLLSLSKLSAAFSDLDRPLVDEKIEEIDNEQLLISYQEGLPSALVEKLQTTVDTTSVLPPQKLIELYIGDDNVGSNEVDFKKAFELIPFLQPDEMETEEKQVVVGGSEEAETWNLLIWSRAICKDTWANIDPSESPFETFNHTVLFKLLKLAYETNLLVDILPDVDKLLKREELANLCKNTSFVYLLRASFEQVQRMQVKSVE